MLDHMGYSLTQKGCRLLNLQTKIFFVSRDVKFVEGVFSFKIDSKDDDRLFRFEHTDFTDTTLDIVQPDKSFEHIDSTNTIEDRPGNNEGSPTSSEMLLRSSQSIKAPSWQNDYDILNNCLTMHPT